MYESGKKPQPFIGKQSAHRARKRKMNKCYILNCLTLPSHQNKKKKPQNPRERAKKPPRDGSNVVEEGKKEMALAFVSGKEKKQRVHTAAQEKQMGTC